MKQGVLPFQYEQEKRLTGMTALSGLIIYLELLHASGLKSSIERYVGLREYGQGWTDSQIVNSLILLNPVSSTGQVLNSGMKRLVLGREWVSRRLKAVRFTLIALPGRVMCHARRLIIRLARGHPSYELLLRARQRILALAAEP